MPPAPPAPAVSDITSGQVALACVEEQSEYAV